MQGDLTCFASTESLARMPQPETLVRVVAPHFVAGLVVVDGRCCEAAPILRWAIGKSTEELRRYFTHKGWLATQRPVQRRAAV